MSDPRESTRLLQGHNGDQRYGSTSTPRRSAGNGIQRSIYDCTHVKVVFGVGVLLALINTFSLLYLVTLLYHPNLPSPFTTSPLLQANLHLISLLVLLPSLVLLEISSTGTKHTHTTSLVLVVVLAVLLAALTEFRQNGTALSSLPALLLLALSLLWTLAAGRVIEHLSRDYIIESDEAQQRLITVTSQDAQPKWERGVKVVLSIVGTFFITVLLALLVSNVAVDGWDSGVRVPGTKVKVNVNVNVGDSDSNSRSVRMHIGVSQGREPPETASEKPTAIFFPPIGVSGYTASHWLRSMVIRGGDGGSNSSDDGHLSLPRAIWFDRLGTGLSDYIRNEEDLTLQASALLDGIEKLGLLKLKPSNDSSSPPSPSDQFVLVSLHDGYLLSNVFASILPSSDLVHSQVLIDAETAASYYSTDVSSDSGLRRGYPQSTLGIIIKDLVPALFSPLNPFRLLDMPLNRRRLERILGNRHKLAPSLPAAISNRQRRRRLSPSWSSSTPHLTLLSHHLDAAQGINSHNFHVLNATAMLQSITHHLHTRPTAVLSSFWKMGLDPSGWGERVQRSQLVAPALHRKLVGWWKVGSRDTMSNGGDQGLPEGLCADEALGRVWCEEAVRKVLAWTEGKE